MRQTQSPPCDGELVNQIVRATLCHPTSRYALSMQAEDSFILSSATLCNLQHKLLQSISHEDKSGLVDRLDNSACRLVLALLCNGLSTVDNAEAFRIVEQIVDREIRSEDSNDLNFIADALVVIGERALPLIKKVFSSCKNYHSAHSHTNSFPSALKSIMFTCAEKIGSPAVDWILSELHDWYSTSKSMMIEVNDFPSKITDLLNQKCPENVLAFGLSMQNSNNLTDLTTLRFILLHPQIEVALSETVHQLKRSGLSSNEDLSIAIEILSFVTRTPLYEFHCQVSDVALGAAIEGLALILQDQIRHQSTKLPIRNDQSEALTTSLPNVSTKNVFFRAILSGIFGIKTSSVEKIPPTDILSHDQHLGSNDNSISSVINTICEIVSGIYACHPQNPNCSLRKRNWFVEPEVAEDLMARSATNILNSILLYIDYVERYCPSGYDSSHSRHQIAGALSISSVFADRFHETLKQLLDSGNAWSQSLGLQAIQCRIPEEILSLEWAECVRELEISRDQKVGALAVETRLRIINKHDPGSIAIECGLLLRQAEHLNCSEAFWNSVVNWAHDRLDLTEELARTGLSLCFKYHSEYLFESMGSWIEAYGEAHPEWLLWPSCTDLLHKYEHDMSADTHYRIRYVVAELLERFS